MTQRVRAGLTAVFTMALVWCCLAVPAAVSAADNAKTEDVIYMRDGRILHGQILEETRTEVVFEYLDPNINITTKLKLRLPDIEQIKRDLPLAGADEETDVAVDVEPAINDMKPVGAAAQTREQRKGRVYGAHRGDISDTSLPSFYVVPMTGQMGTDISSEVYREMVDDIRAAKPSVLVIELKCDELRESDYYGIMEEESGLDGSTSIDDYRKVLAIFHNELRDIPQVVWVKDSVGVSSVIALSWKDLYMAPNANLGGLAKTAGNFLRVKHDENTFGKYREAYMAWLKGLVGYGDLDTDVIDAMVRPEFKLSATWKGREVEWMTSEDGQYIVDGDEEATVSFNAKSAEDLCISKGTAESLDDLALLLGIREYRVLDSNGETIYNRYVENWRRTFDNAAAEMQNFRKYMSWAGGEDAVKYLGRAKTSLEKVLAAMNRYEAVEIRFQMGGLSRFQIETQIEQIKEMIRQGRSTGGGFGGGAGGGAAGSR